MRGTKIGADGGVINTEYMKKKKFPTIRIFVVYFPKRSKIFIFYDNLHSHEW